MVTVEIKGLTELQAKLAGMPKQLEQNVSALVERGAQTFVRNAKQAAPVNFGVLRNQISYFKSNSLSFKVVSGARYSPYLEWGTITRVQVEPELASYASQFKGRGIRKTGGIYPRHFFFPQAPIVKEQTEKDIQRFIDSQKL